VSRAVGGTVPARWRDAVPDYPQVGASRALLDGGPGPAGYRVARVRIPIGQGADAAARAGTALLGWGGHLGAGARVASTGAPAALAVGDTAVSRFGPGPLAVAAPCRVLWVQRTAERTAFGYGTLPGHPVRGEEGFAVQLDGAGRVWFEAASFSRPAGWAARAAGPMVPLLQKAFLHRCGRALRRAAAGQR
jgi:uncharacterized protein (UPF0548 family)